MPRKTMDAEQIHKDLLSHAKQELQEVEEQLAKLDEDSRKIHMLRLASGEWYSKTKPTILTKIEQETILERLFKTLCDLKERKTFWQRRIQALENYDIQKFDEQYTHDIENTGLDFD